VALASGAPPFIADPETPRLVRLTQAVLRRVVGLPLAPATVAILGIDVA
jgi:hypothetical protein